MSFENLMLLPLIIIFLVAYIFWYITSEKKFFTFIKDHWFFRRTFTHKVSTFLYLLGVSGIVLSLVDMRGPEELIKGEMNIQRTILLIDTSQSMLAEDVRPSRYKKAILLARHFVKNAVGHQISVIVFSDGVKRIVPFTGDVDLLDARLQALETMDLKHGGTALGAALNEAVQYFRTSQSMIGNILLFTDAENNEAMIDMKFPDDVSLGVIGIGTARGAPIPERDRNGNLIGNKKFKGEVVITKLDETFLKNLGNDVKNYRFWIGTSYSLPTSEILAFFNKSYKDKLNENQFRVKPILTHYLLIPSLLVFTLAMLLRLKGTFVAGFLLFTVFSGFENGYAQEKKTPEKTERIKELEHDFHLGRGTDAKKLELAQEYLHAGFYPEAKILYEEALEKKSIEGNEFSYVNYATTLLATGELKEGLELSRKVEGYLQKNNLFDPLTKLQHNVVLALNNSSSGEGEDQGKDQDQNQSEDENKDSKDGQSGGEGNDKKDNENQEGKGQENQNDNKDQNDQENQDEEKDQENKDSQNKDPNKPDDKKMPSLLKQLISDDNKLQKQLIDAKTQGRGDRDKKDW